MGGEEEALLKGKCPETSLVGGYLFQLRSSGRKRNMD